LFLYGPGGNGKSKFVDALSWVMGTYFVKPVADLYIKKAHTRHMESVAMLAGARMVTMSEVPAGAAWDEGALKDHTGGGQVTANFMRENSFSFTPQFKLTAYGNHQPTFPGGINPAIKRRFKMMLLDFVPAVVDETLEETFRKEAPGILRWALNGLCGPRLGWLNTGLMVSQVMEDVTNEYIDEQDIFGEWLGDRTEPKKGSVTGAVALHDDWISYRNSQGNHDMFNHVNHLVTEMKRRGYAKAERSMKNRGFADIVLKIFNETPFSG
jgi:putative DNA primase/helicase